MIMMVMEVLLETENMVVIEKVIEKMVEKVMVHDPTWVVNWGVALLHLRV